MFYNNSEEIFPNWWDALDGASDSGLVGDTCPADHAGIRQVDRDGVVLQTGSSEAVDAADRGDQEEGPAEQDNGPLSPDGYCYCYRYPGLNDPHVSEASEAAASKLPFPSDLRFLLRSKLVNIVFANIRGLKERRVLFIAP